MNKVHVRRDEQFSEWGPKLPQLPMPERGGGAAEQRWHSAAIAQPDSEELGSPVTHANKELTFKPNHINIAVSY